MHTLPTLAIVAGVALVLVAGYWWHRSLAARDDHINDLYAAVAIVTEERDNLATELEWAEIVNVAQAAELDRIQSHYLLLPTLAGVRAEHAAGNQLRPAGGAA